MEHNELFKYIYNRQYIATVRGIAATVASTTTRPVRRVLKRGVTFKKNPINVKLFMTTCKNIQLHREHEAH